MDKTTIIIAIIAFFAGSNLRGYADRLRHRIIERFITSDFGREVIREVVVNQVAKTTQKDRP